MSLRDWLIVTGVVILLIIVVDGIRRMRKRNKLRLDIDTQYEDFPEQDLSAEFPNGGARIVKAESAHVDVIQTQLVTEPDGLADTDTGNADDDVDLLLDAEFKGVGQGADRWLTDRQPVNGSVESVEVDVEKNIIEQSVTEHKVVEQSLAERSVYDAPQKENDIEDVATSLSSEGSESKLESEDEIVESVDHANVAGRIEPAFSEEIDLLKADTVAELREFTDTSNEVDDLTDGIVDPVRVKNATEEKPNSESKPELNVVDSVDNELDLNQPITELMAQMGTAQSMPSESEAEQLLAGDESVSSNLGASNTQQSSVSITALSSSSPTVSAQTESVQTTSQSTQENEPELELGLVAEPVKEQAVINEAHQIAAELDPAPAESLPTPRGPAATKRKAKKPAKKSAMRRLKEEIQTSFFDLDPDLAPDPDVSAEVESKPKRSRRSRHKAVERSSGVAANVEEEKIEQEPAPVLVIGVWADDLLPGVPLFKLVQACGMEYGEMKIFHRYEDGCGQGAVQFNMVNSVQPGIFELDQQEAFSTPGVSFFLEMSQPKDLMNAFECMLATAQYVADNLHGVLKDQDRSVMRTQTIEHYRQQIHDYERSQLTKRA